MADHSDIINSNPIGEKLDNAHEYIIFICTRHKIDPSPDAWDRLKPEDLGGLAALLVGVLRLLPASHNLPSKYGCGTLCDDLKELDLTKTDRLKPLLNAVLAKKPDKEIWDAVYDAVPEKKPLSTSPRRHPQVTKLVELTSCFYDARSVVNPSEYYSSEYSSKYRKDADLLLLEKLGYYMYAEISDFCKTYFGRVAGLDDAHELVFKKCTQGRSPLFDDNGWSGWPKPTDQHKVLHWFTGLVEQLSVFAKEYEPTPMDRRSLLARPDKLLDRKLHVGLITRKDSRKWSRVLVPGELKSHPKADKDKSTWHDIGRYAKEVLTGQDTRRFVLSFTLCGSLMRVWVFDRLGVIASDVFDINKDGRQFVYIVLGFLWMNHEDLGYDPTVVVQDGQGLIEITRNNKTEQFVLDTLIRRTSCIIGRATTCWRAHRIDDPQTSFVIKDSWQEDIRRQEGELLQIATEKCVDNVVRYYHHQDVFVRGQVDSVRDNIRGKLDISKANATSQASDATGQTDNATNRKRAFDQAGAPLPPSKRCCRGSESRTKGSSSALLSNPPERIHRRVVLLDYGKPIYKASSLVALLKALEGCIRGHKSLRERAGILHRDISINNLMINEDVNNDAPFSFLIDLDLAIEEGDQNAKLKIGTRPFMAIGALMGEPPTYMHDLESFFWVLFWICVNYEAEGKKAETLESSSLDIWNNVSDVGLYAAKKDMISNDRVVSFMQWTQVNFTSYYWPLIRCVYQLRQVVFPNGFRRREPNPYLYDLMVEVLQKAQNDPEVIGGEAQENPEVDG